MEITTILQSASDLLSSWATEMKQPEEERVDVYLPAEKIVEAVTALVNTGVWHLSAITGLDIPQSQESDGEIEIIYHFCQKAAIISLRIKVSYGIPIALSICKIIPAAVLYEREVVEMFGVILEGNPMREKLLLPDDWPDYVYPLRKSFKGLE